MKLIPQDLEIIRIFSLYKEKNLTKNLAEYYTLLDTLIYLHETLAEQELKFPNWWTYSDTLMTKFVLHSNTLYDIAYGSSLKSNYYKEFAQARIIDIPSLKVVLRAQLEAFLMYHYLYVNPNSEDEKEFRFNAWMYTSLIERQSFPSDTEFAKNQRQRDAIELQKLEQQLKASPTFSKLSTSQQNTLLRKGNARLYNSWKTILEESGFSSYNIFSNFYSILSNYAHSEALSILQIKQSNFGYSESNEQANLNLFLSKQVICLMITTLLKLYKVIDVKFHTLPITVQATIHGYSSIAKHSPLKKSASA